MKKIFILMFFSLFFGSFSLYSNNIKTNSFYLDCNGSDLKNTSFTIYNTKDVIIKNCIFNNSKIALSFENVKNVSLINNSFYNCGKSFLFINSKNLKIYNNTFVNSPYSFENSFLIEMEGNNELFDIFSIIKNLFDYFISIFNN